MAGQSLFRREEMGKERLKSSSETRPLIGSLEEALGEHGEEVFFLALLLGERTDLRRWESGLEFKCDKKVGGQGNGWEEAPNNNPSAMEFLA